MANDKKGFIMYCDLLEHIEPLNMEQRGILLTAILCDQSETELPEMDVAERIAFSFIKKGIDMNTTKYNAIVEKRREAGKKGGRPKKEESKQKQTKANKNKDEAKKPDNREQITDNREQITDNGDKRIAKKPYGEYNNVFLSDEELEKLKSEYPSMCDIKLEALSEYLMTHNKSYKSHYATIRQWIKKDLKKGEENEKTENTGDRGQTFEI